MTQTAFWEMVKKTTIWRGEGRELEAKGGEVGGWGVKISVAK
jgi:hypothetical protein